jgi:hypothetical protein
MSSDKRKDLRQPLRYPAEIDIGDGSPPKPCLISNVSASGAKVTIPNANEIPDRLFLILAPEQGTRRRCIVVWRSPDALGLEFIKTPPKEILKPSAIALKAAAAQRD